MAVRGPHHRNVDSDAVEPDDTVHPTSLDWRLALQFHTKFGKEGSSSVKVVDNDADVVHPLNRHIASIGADVCSPAGSVICGFLIASSTRGVSGSWHLRAGRREVPDLWAVWYDGWKAVTTHPTISGWSHFNDDTWELYHTDTDPSDLHDLAAEHPGQLRELVNLWFAEAGANGAFPLDDRSAVEILTTPRPQLTSPRNRYAYFPDTAEIPETQAVNIRNRSYSIGALVDIPGPGAQGVLFAHGSPFGGHALYVKDNRLHYVYSFVGITEQKIDAAEDNLILSASFDKDGEDPPGVATGTLTLYYGDYKVGGARIKTQSGVFQLAGEGLCVGRDSGAAVTDDYPGEHPHRFTGGVIKRVAVDVSGEPHVNLERGAAAMLARE